jgi:hypothetical protein
VVAETGLAIERLLQWLELSAGKYYDWAQRYGRINQHNGRVPRDFWLADWKKTAVLDFQLRYPLEGYRRLTYMMIDADVVADSPSSVFRVLRDAGRLGYFPRHPSKKGTGFQPPLAPHEHWHIDIAHITSTERSTTSAPLEPAATLSIGVCGSRCGNRMSRSCCSGPRSSSPMPIRASSPTTDRSSSRRTSRNSSASWG